MENQVIVAYADFIGQKSCEWWAWGDYKVTLAYIHVNFLSTCVAIQYNYYNAFIPEISEKNDWNLTRKGQHN